MRGETPAEFYGIITEGRGPDMPAFGTELSSDERWGVVYYIWRFSTTSDPMQTGSEIYTSNCASCHGEDGRSMILGAANFSDQRFLANQSPSDLYVSVTQGQGSMPAFQARLGKDDRWAVIDYIRTFSYDPTVSDEAEVSQAEPGESEPEEDEELSAACEPYLLQDNPFDWEDTAAIAGGEALYDSCTGCHGEDGKGRLPGILDFTDPSFQADLHDNPGKYLCSIAEGYNSMPAFKSTLDEEEMWKVLLYLAILGD
jgi:mono/diheme cytochrome c family protein